ncbi:hypothetical protein [Microaceticoccus formicicus]|uniref:hypothetical protein n=1 Tax=Microaceticoccus formicicus TaxID=3118105 RepID=UPI003CD01243|nr:hypothetical protein VZL98_00540 [Peptoniphilaceae bacterium AMB_02]
MKYSVLFRIEKIELLEKLRTKIKNLRNYMEEEKHEFEIEIVFSGNVVEYFKGDYSEFLDPKLDIILCNNALKNANMEPISDQNIRTVRAGIGEIIVKKAEGWIEFTIE